MVDWNEIADRFFSFHAEKPQAELIRMFQTTQTQVSRWKLHKEKIPFKVLMKLVDTENVTWDWLLEGREPKHRS